MFDINETIQSGNYYVYHLLDRGVPFYVGKGKGDRLYSHEEYAKGNRDLGYGLAEDYNQFKSRKIRKILCENRQIEYNIVFVSNDEQLVFEKEMNDIIYFGRRGIDANGILTNRTIGGRGGNILHTLSEERQNEARKKMSKSRCGSKNPNWDPTPEGAEKRKRRAQSKKNGIGKKFQLKDPSGIIHKGQNITQFAIENDLSVDQLKKVVRGTANHHKGWTNYRSQRFTPDCN